VDTLRYYERIGLIPPVNRSENVIRDYNELDLRRVEFIKCMRSAGLPIETLIEYYKLVQQMEEIQKTLDLVDYKIDVYEKILLRKEKDLIAMES